MSSDTPFERTPCLTAALTNLMILSEEITRTVFVNGRRRIVRIEAEIWDDFCDIAARAGCGVDQVAEKIAAELGDQVSLSSGLRVYVLKNIRQKVGVQDTAGIALESYPGVF